MTENSLPPTTKLDQEAIYDLTCMLSEILEDLEAGPEVTLHAVLAIASATLAVTSPPGHLEQNLLLASMSLGRGARLAAGALGQEGGVNVAALLQSITEGRGSRH